MSKVTKSYNKASKSYKLTLSGLTKYQFQTILTILRNICPQYVIANYYNGLTLPFVECTTFLPLSRSPTQFLVANYQELSELLDQFGNNDLPNRNVIYDADGNKISRL